MARRARADGIRTLVATPHSGDGTYANDPETIRAAVVDLNRALKRAGIDVAVLPGAEIRLDAGDLGQQFKAGRLQTLNDSGRYVLVELPPLDWLPQTAEILWNLRLAGAVPVLAHVERIGPLQERPRRIEELVRCGLGLQITAMSLNGGFGPPARKLAGYLLRQGWVHAIATDAHSVHRRPPLLSNGVVAAGRIIGRRQALQLVMDLPQRILAGLSLPLPVLPSVAPQRSVLGIVFATLKGLKH